RSAEALDEAAPIRLLLVADADHVDLGLDPEQRPGEDERAAPLSRAVFGEHPRDALGAIVDGLISRGFRLLRAGRRDALVLEVDPRRRVERLLQADRPVQRRRAVDAVCLANLLWDLDQALGADLLANELHREQRCQRLGPDRLARARMERWRQRRR